MLVFESSQISYPTKIESTILFLSIEVGFFLVLINNVCNVSMNSGSDAASRTTTKRLHILVLSCEIIMKN